MSKELKALKKIEDELSGIASTLGVRIIAGNYREQARVDYQIDLIEKSLKALEIIKSKEMLSVFQDIYGKYFIVFNGMGIEIPQEEYDLLREVL